MPSRYALVGSAAPFSRAGEVDRFFVKRRISEWDVIALLESALSTGRSARVEVGIGDDAAILRVPAGRLAWTVDAQVEHVHFERAWLSLSDLGFRSFVAAASDLSAMGARPIAALSSLVLPRTTSRKDVTAIGRGQAAASRVLACPVVGGNVSSGESLSITTTVLGSVRQPLHRHGARIGDELWLMGDVGMARLGLYALGGAEQGRRRHSPPVEACCRAWRRPRPRVGDGLRLARRAHCAIDVSDGLAGDAAHVARASRVKLVFDETRLRRALSPELVEAAAELGLDEIEVALSGGEDYALLSTGTGRPPRGSRTVGHVERGSGVFIEGPAGRRRRLRAGFDHFHGR